MAKAYVKRETPKEIVDLFYAVAAVAKDSGRIRKGINEVTKSVERNNAKLVVMAMDVDPEEIMMHLPGLCEEKGVAYMYCPTKEELGKTVGLTVPTSAVAIEDAGNAKEKLRTIVERLTGKEEKAEQPKEKKEEPKPQQSKEKKKEHKKEETTEKKE